MKFISPVSGFRSRKMAVLCGLIAVSCYLFPNRSAVAVTTFSEGIFDESGLTSFEALDDSPGGVNTFTADQSLDGGNTGAFLRNSLTVVSNSTLFVGNLFDGLDYSPSEQGSFARIDYSLDAIFLGGSAGTSQFAVRLIVQQDGTNYITGAFALSVATGPGNGQPGNWTHFSHTGITADLFNRVGGAGEHPDFSTNGAPFSIGVLSSITASAQTVSITGGVDNLIIQLIETNDVDVAVTKTADADTVPLGSNITYTVTITNKGPSAVAPGVTVTDFLPDDVTFVSAIASQGTCTNIGDNVECDLGDLTNSATVTIVATPTSTGTLTNVVSVDAVSEFFSDDNEASAVTTVTPLGDDLSPLIENASISCMDTAPGTSCSLSGDLILRHDGVPFATASLSFNAICKKCPDKTKWKLAGFLDLETLDLTGVPDHSLAIYLSDDDTFGDGDTLLVKKPIGILKFAKAFSGGKPIKIKAKVPSGTDLSGKYLILVQDNDDVVDEANENNNTVAIGPIS